MAWLCWIGLLFGEIIELGLEWNYFIILSALEDYDIFLPEFRKVYSRSAAILHFTEHSNKVLHIKDSKKQWTFLHVALSTQDYGVPRETKSECLLAPTLSTTRTQWLPMPTSASSKMPTSSPTTWQQSLAFHELLNGWITFTREMKLAVNEEWGVSMNLYECGCYQDPKQITGSVRGDQGLPVSCPLSHRAVSFEQEPNHDNEIGIARRSGIGNRHLFPNINLNYWLDNHVGQHSIRRKHYRRRPWPSVHRHCCQKPAIS